MFACQASKRPGRYFALGDVAIRPAQAAQQQGHINIMYGGAGMQILDRIRKAPLLCGLRIRPSPRLSGRLGARRLDAARAEACKCIVE